MPVRCLYLLEEEEVLTHTPYNFVNFKQGSIIWSEWLIIFTSGMFSQQLVDPVASLVVTAILSREY